MFEASISFDYVAEVDPDMRLHDHWRKSHSDFEPIAERVDGEEMPRRGGNVFDLLAQLNAFCLAS